MLEIHMTRQQYFALLSIVLDRQMDKKSELTREWWDVNSDQTVTIEDLLSLLSIKI